MNRGTQTFNLDCHFGQVIHPPTISGSEDTAEVSQNMPPTPQKEGEKEGEEGELKKQEMLVQYLKDTETFALQVERAISVINSMLYLKSTTGRSVCVRACAHTIYLNRCMHT